HAEHCRCIEDIEKIDDTFDLAEVLAESEALRTTQVENLHGRVEERTDWFDGQAQWSLTQTRRIDRAAIRFTLGDPKCCGTCDAPRQVIASERFVLPVPIIQSVVVAQ